MQEQPITLKYNRLLHNRSAENSVVACTCTNHVLYVAVMRDVLHLKCLVLCICTPISWSAVTSAMLAGGKSQLLEKALSAAVIRTWELPSAVHTFFPRNSQDLSLYFGPKSLLSSGDFRWNQS